MRPRGMWYKWFSYLTCDIGFSRNVSPISGVQEIFYIVRCWCFGVVVGPGLFFLGVANLASARLGVAQRAWWSLVLAFGRLRTVICSIRSFCTVRNTANCSIYGS